MKKLLDFKLKMEFGEENIYQIYIKKHVRLLVGIKMLLKLD